MADTGVLGAQILVGEAGLPRLPEAVFGGHVLELAELGDGEGSIVVRFGCRVPFAHAPETRAVPPDGLGRCDALAEPRDTRAILEPDVGRARFQRAHRAPHADLDSHLERHWIVTWDLRDADPFVQEILPHPCIHIASEPGLIGIHGIPMQRSPHRIDGEGMVIGTKFRPGGFRGFADVAAEDLSDLVVPLGEAFGEAGEGLEAELARAAGDVDAHVAAVEGFLLERLPRPDPRYDVVAAVVADMLTVAPSATVAELAERHAVSPRTLQRLFREYVGVGPKWVLKRYRMHEAAERIATGVADDIAALALDLGYFDQAHFTSDFSAQIGRPPAEYARACAAAAGRLEPALTGS